MKKRILALLLAMLMVLSLAACAAETPAPEADKPAEETPEAPTEETPDAPAEETPEAPAEEPAEEGWTGEVAHIIVTYNTLGTTPPDLQKVQDAVNARTVPEIGVEVEFRATSAFDAFALYPTWIATGERVDLMMPLLQDLRTYVDQGLVEPLDDLIAENAPYLTQLIAEGQPLTSNNIIDGVTYAITTVPNMNGMNGAFIATKALVDEVGWEYDENKIYTYDELGELFKLIKEAHPEMYPCGVVTTGKTASEYGYASVTAYDSIAGSATYTGVLMGADSTTIVNLFETEEYKSYIEHLREWNLAGYIHPDASTTDTSINAMQDAGVSAGYFMVGAPIQAGEDDYIINLGPKYQASAGMGGWVIPMTAEEPEAALRFVDLVWQDVELMNLIQWGIEGDHYVMLDESSGLIGFPEGVDATTSAYYNSLGLWGDARYAYIWSPSVTQADNDAYTAEAAKLKTQGIGIGYSNANVINEVTAIAAVVAQYIPALESGSVDLDTYYPEFIDALKAAGIDTVIADKQAQFDAQYGG